jgi:hypothetical protein
MKPYLVELECNIFEGLVGEGHAEQHVEGGNPHHMAEPVYHIGRIVEEVETLKIPANSHNLSEP